MNYIRIIPYLFFGRFWAKIEKDNAGGIDFDIPDIKIDVLARKSSGEYKKVTFNYPTDAMDLDDVRIDIFNLYKNEYAQIVNVWINDVKISIEYGTVSSVSDISFRYDDSVFHFPSLSMDPISLDFQIIETNDPKVLLVMDNSVWGVIEEVDAIINITLPAEDYPVTLYFSKHAVNSYNSIYLNYNCVNGNVADFKDLPDGVYEIELVGAGGKIFKRSYLRTVLLRKKIDTMYIDCLMDCDNINEPIRKNIQTIETYIAAAEANMRNNNNEMAYRYYSIADKLSDKCKC